MTSVLIVEDNVELANVIRSLLEFENHTVDVFHTGTQALESILVNPYDLIILDWDLPGVSGLQILTQFRERGARTPVIMITGKVTVEEKEAGLDGGADDYLTKPFDMKELGARVRAHLRRSTAGTTDSVNLADISLDCANQRAAKGGRTHVLTAQEFQLLEFAAKYPHIQPSCADLLAAVWPGDTEKSEQKLRMAIRRLRKKFDPAGAIIFTHLFNEASAMSANQPVGSGLSPLELDAHCLVGTIFNGKYEIVELIGGGGSGLVYSGKHLVLDKSVAIKVLHLNILSQSDTARRFQREAKVTALLSHPNIVVVSDFGFAEQGQPYLVMELVEGASLAEVLEQYGRPPVAAVIDIFYQACAGLDHAHKKGVVHRDIKPSNFMLVKTGANDVMVKLVDFGLARTTEVEQGIAKITQTGHVLGSPPYMSPEQCRGEPVDARSDIYSIGCALFETLQGRAPFGGSDPIAILVKHVTDQPPEISLPEVPPVVQTGLSKIVDKCLAKAREGRYQSAAELMDALAEFLSEKRETDGTDITDPDLAQQSWAARKKDVLSWLNRRFQI